MPSLVAFVLYVVSAVWVGMVLWTALDRYRHERQARRLADLKHRLHESAVGDTSSLRKIADDISVAQLAAVLTDGLPPAMETAIARAMHEQRAELLRRAWNASSEWDRIAAVRILVAAGVEQRYEFLDKMLRSATPVLGAASIRILARIDDRRSAGLLIAALRDGVYSRSRIAAAIDMMSVSRADLLAPLFDASQPEVRFWAAKLAGRLNARQWLARVRRMAGDVDPLVRRAALEAIGVLGDESDQHLLLRSLTDRVPFVRAHGARACARFATRETADALVALLSDRHWIVRAAAREALQCIGAPAIPALVQALWHSDTFAANSAAEVLHRTGGAANVARQMLSDADAGKRQRPILARFLAVGGPYLQSAFLAQFNSRERRDLMNQLEPALGTR